MPIRHAFTSPKSDGADSTLLQPSNWNANHVGSPDDRIWYPSGTPLFADEFDDGSFAGWTTCEVAGHGYDVVESGAVLSAVHSGTIDSSPSGHYHTRLRTLPVGFTVGSYLQTCARLITYTGGSPMVGVILTDGTVWTTATNYVFVGIYSPGAGDGRLFSTIRCGKFAQTESTVYDGAYSSLGTVGVHVRLKYEAANTWGVWISPDGVGWVQGSTRSYTMTPTHMGIATTTWNQSNVAMTWDYFRVY